MVSVNTNIGALAALQNLSQTNRDLQQVQSRINTGQKVASAIDNGAIFAIAESQRTRVDALGAVRGGIDRAKSAIDFGVKAGEAVNDILKQMRVKAQEAAGTGLSSEDRAKLQTDFDKLKTQVDQIASAATYNGVNLAKNGSLTVTTTDGVGGGGSFVVASNLGASAAAVTTGQNRVSNSTRLSDFITNIETAATAADVLTFTQGTNTGTNAFTVKLSANDTVQQLVDKINTATGGAIRAGFDEVTGQLFYSSSSTFTVAKTESDTNTVAAADATFLIGNGTAQDLSVATNASAAGDTNLAVYGVNGGGAGNTISVTGADFSLSGLGLSGTLSISDQSGAESVVATLDSKLNTLRTNLSSLGSQSKALEVQSTFLSKLSDTLEGSIGNLVDADLAKESARLQSLQVKQQLGTQALSIANQAPQSVLSLFR